MNASLIYEGSVKKLWDLQDGTLEFEFTDAYSVFDWGQMPDDLPRKGESLAQMGAFFFEKIALASTWQNLNPLGEALIQQWESPYKRMGNDESVKRQLVVMKRVWTELLSNGMPSHFIRKTKPNGFLVRKMAVQRPALITFNGASVYDYTQVKDLINACKRQNDQGAFLPLEVVFRWGVPQGSSFLERVDETNFHQWGLLAPPREGDGFSVPVVEFFSKLESKDRLLSTEQAMAISALSVDEFYELHAKTVFLSLWLKDFFAHKGLRLWDGKFEWAIMNQTIVLVDAIGPDELRLTDQESGVHLSKEILRQIYKKLPWYSDLQNAKKSTEKKGKTNWKSEVSSTPPALDGADYILATTLYPALTKLILSDFWEAPNSVRVASVKSRPIEMIEFIGHAKNSFKKESVAVVGAGGREHALAKKFLTESQVEAVYVYPGNAGINLNFAIGQKCLATGITPQIDGPQEFIQSLRSQGIQTVVIGADDYLAAGWVDFLKKEEFTVFGPTKAAAQLEASKSLAKEVMEKSGVPTARYELLNSYESGVIALNVLSEKWGGYPLVMKYDGLALGKGVRIVQNYKEAQTFLSEIYVENIFSHTTSPKVIVEEFLPGKELSLFALCDGSDYVLLEPSCDHKQLNDNNLGPNTGGMGAYSPVPWLHEAIKQHRFSQWQQLGDLVIAPILAEMKRRQTPFTGLLYAGLMIGPKGIHVLEYNVRFGDPETQAVLARMKSPLLPLLKACAQGTLKETLKLHPLSWDERCSVHVVASAPGYPYQPKRGLSLMWGHDHLLSTNFVSLAKKYVPQVSQSESSLHLYFAGINKNSEGMMETSGGRVFGVTALGDDFFTARTRAYHVLIDLHFDQMHFRKDIAESACG